LAYVCARWVARRPLTGARIETFDASRPQRAGPVAPSRGRGSKRVVRALLPARGEVAPSRGRGSKLNRRPAVLRRALSPPHGGADRNHLQAWQTMVGPRSPPHGGADRNTSAMGDALTADGRPLTGARIETSNSC